MSEETTALGAAYEVFRHHLTGKGMWGKEAHPDGVRANVEKPYCVYFLAGGTEERTRHIESAEFVITVKVVAKSFKEAVLGAQQISNELYDHGSQDETPLPDNEYWDITTILQGARVHLVELAIDGTPDYHSGHQFVVTMQKK